MTVAIQMAMIMTIMLEMVNGNSGRVMGRRNFKYLINVYDMVAGRPEFAMKVQEFVSFAIKDSGGVGVGAAGLMIFL